MIYKTQRLVSQKSFHSFFFVLNKPNKSLRALGSTFLKLQCKCKSLQKVKALGQASGMVTSSGAGSRLMELDLDFWNGNRALELDLKFRNDNIALELDLDFWSWIQCSGMVTELWSWIQSSEVLKFPKPYLSVLAIDDKWPGRGQEPLQTQQH